MKRKTTAELLRDAFLRDGYIEMPIGYKPPKRQRRATATKTKPGRNGKRS